MSASEKLKVLEERLKVEDLESWEGEMTNLAEVMADTLPQIRALVEAAENLRKADPPGSGPYAYTPQQELKDVKLALADLDKALP